MTHEIKEHAGAILGVPGRFHNAHARGPTWPGTWSTQTWISEYRAINGYGTNGEMRVEIRYDDNCKNGHNSFAITANVYTVESRRQRDIAAGGCLHDEIARIFPELVPLIKWHLTSSDGPMHYIANTIFHASNRDHNGLLAGERRQIRNGRSGLPAWKLAYIDGNGSETEKPTPYIDSETRPDCGVTVAYIPWEHIGEGKERQFDFARNSAVWPEATDEQLSTEPDALRAMLAARLPQLLADFRAAIDSSGLALSPETIGEQIA